MARGPLIIVSGPSGSGKSTVIGRVLARFGSQLRLAVSATTRPRRDYEVAGVHYYFWTKEEFEKHLAAGEFLEHASVHGNCYGTLRREVDEPRARGVGVILDIDVQGAEHVRAIYPECKTIFLMTSSAEAYEKRIRQRGTDDEASIRRRLETARRELARAEEFDSIVINDDLAVAVKRVGDLVADALGKGPKDAG